MYEESENELAGMVTNVARDLLSHRTVQGTLDRVTHLAVENIDGCHHAGILLVQPGLRVATTAATSPLVVDSNEAQADFGQGPCFDAARNEQNYRVVDMRTENRWPRYVPKARELGIGSMMGFQLFSDEQSLGALNLYSETPYAFTPVSEQAGWVFASHAAVALVGAREAEQLHLAIETRQQLGEALGILMERHTTSEQDAFARLKQASQDRNVTLHDSAQSVVAGNSPEVR